MSGRRAFRQGRHTREKGGLGPCGMELICCLAGVSRFKGMTLTLAAESHQEAFKEGSVPAPCSSPTPSTARGVLRTAGFPAAPEWPELLSVHCSQPSGLHRPAWRFIDPLQIFAKQRNRLSQRRMNFGAP